MVELGFGKTRQDDRAKRGEKMKLETKITSIWHVDFQNVRLGPSRFNLASTKIVFALKYVLF